MELQNHVKSIADDLSDPALLDRLGQEYEQEEYGIIDYLEGVLDIEYIVGASGDYRGARVLVSFGGPNIWINTRTNTVEGRWWEDSVEASFEDSIGLDDTLRELWETEK